LNTHNQYSGPAPAGHEDDHGLLDMATTPMARHGKRQRGFNPGQRWLSRFSPTAEMIAKGAQRSTGRIPCVCMSDGNTHRTRVRMPDRSAMVVRLGEVSYGYICPSSRKPPTRIESPRPLYIAGTHPRWAKRIMGWATPCVTPHVRTNGNHRGSNCVSERTYMFGGIQADTDTDTASFNHMFSQP
jgi:hypothetical protein